MKRHLLHSSGFTLIEVIIVVLIAGIIASVALRSAVTISDTARTEETKQELEALAIAIIGNTELENNGVRSNFGYVGDIGAMPPNLDALNSNPGSYTTWKGPYIDNDFTQKTDDYKTDAWNSAYVYSGVNITSSGSGSDIVRTLGKCVNDFTLNEVKGIVLDLDGTPPGSIYDDSVSVRLTIPNGSGGTVTKSTTVDVGGFFSFDSIPIGNHDLKVIYVPDNDTLPRFVSVLPASSPYGEYTLSSDVWTGSGSGGSGLEMVTGSDTLSPSSFCNNVSFWVSNTTPSPITISSIELTWTSPTAYYRTVIWNGVTVFDSNNPKAASGELVTFTSPQTINPGESVVVQFETYESKTTGGPKVDMTGADFTIEFSDGSTFDFIPSTCL